MNPVKNTIFIASILFLSSCASSKFDTGVVDYRRAKVISEVEINKNLNDRLNCENRRDEGIRVRHDSDCQILLPSRLVSKNFGGDSKPISIGDYYTISLDYGFFNYGIKNNPIKRQIAVLVNSFEINNNTNNNNSVGFYNIGNSNKSNSENINEDISGARVVYFSPDIKTEQPFNFSNIPIIAEARYGGGPVGIQVIVIQLDSVPDQLKGLLSNLADLGKTYSGTDPATKTLLSLGKSLINQGNNKIVFEYKLMLDNGDISKNSISPAFSSGRYVFRRIDNRKNALLWDNLFLDQNTGILHILDGIERKDTEGDLSQYKEETYFTVNIKNLGKLNFGNNYSQKNWDKTYSDFRNWLNSNTPNTNEINQKVTNLLEAKTSFENSKSLYPLYIGMVDTWKKYGNWNYDFDTKIENMTDYPEVSKEKAKIDKCINDIQIVNQAASTRSKFLKSSSEQKTRAFHRKFFDLYNQSSHSINEEDANTLLSDLKENLDTSFDLNNSMLQLTLFSASDFVNAYSQDAEKLNGDILSLVKSNTVNLKPQNCEDYGKLAQSLK